VEKWGIEDMARGRRGREREDDVKG